MKEQLRLFGVPVQVELTFFLLPLLAFQWRDLGGVLVWTAVVFVGVLAHELGHALAMRRAGFAPRITLHALGGLTHFPEGARPTARQEFFITLAGPLTGLALGLLGLAAWRLAPGAHPLVDLALGDVVWVNLGWSLVNLLPVLPWDGGLLLDSGLRWARGEPRDRVVAAGSVLVGVAVLGAAVHWRALMLGYFGALGVAHGLARWRGQAADAAHQQAASDWWTRITRGDDVEEELDFLVMTQADPRKRAEYAELLAWARLHKRDFHGARQAVRRMGEAVPSVSLRARLAAAESDVEAVIALLSPPGVASEADVPLLVSALLTRERFDEVVALATKSPSLADRTSERLFQAGAYAQALALCAFERERTGAGRHAYNEACCLCRLGRLDEAVEALHRARALGSPELAALDEDEDLAAIRDRPEVQALRGG